jgi:hypothetical protein
LALRLSVSQRDRGDVSNISTSPFSQQSPIRLPPVRLPSFELAQVVGSEISPAPIPQGISDQLLIPECLSPHDDLPLEHQEATLTRSQRQNAMLVTRYDNGNSGDHMVSAALDSSPCRFSTSIQNGQVFTTAHKMSLSSSQMDPNIQSTISFEPELSLALRSVEIVPPSYNPVIDFLPSALPSAAYPFTATQSRTSLRPIPDRLGDPPASLDPNDPLDRAHHPLPTLQSAFSSVPTMPCEYAKRQPVKPPARSTLSPPPPLHPRLLDSITICESTRDLEDSLCVSRGPRKSHISDGYPVLPHPLDIPKLDYGLPNDFGESLESTVSRR